MTFIGFASTTGFPSFLSRHCLDILNFDCANMLANPIFAALSLTRGDLYPCRVIISYIYFPIFCVMAHVLIGLFDITAVNQFLWVYVSGRARIMDW